MLTGKLALSLYPIQLLKLIQQLGEVDEVYLN